MCSEIRYSHTTFPTPSTPRLSRSSRKYTPAAVVAFALLIRFSQNLPAAELHEMLKKTTLVVPLGDGLFWAGASYQWYFPDLKDTLIILIIVV
ncbi:MAG: hypothetical protein LH618_07530, partial [Saprospiraceae bacterium]|nr:hypothetical protein [Saprospiraceae bacterium]